jgi:hypothetical protein
MNVNVKSVNESQVNALNALDENSQLAAFLQRIRCGLSNELSKLL